jgi:hypothetical protein
VPHPLCRREEAFTVGRAIALAALSELRGGDEAAQKVVAELAPEASESD